MAPITNEAYDSLEYFFIPFFSEKIRINISCESSARQKIHMRHQALFSSKDKSKKKQMSSAKQFCFVPYVLILLMVFYHITSLLFSG